MEIDVVRAFDALPGLVWTALPDGQIDFLNLHWYEFTGLSLHEGSGQGWHTVIHPEDLPQFVDRWLSIFTSSKPGEIEARLRRFDGEYCWFLFSVNPMCDQGGHVVKWYGLNADIEDRKCGEEASRQRELSFQLIVDSVPVPVAVTTPLGEVEYLNRPTLEYFGKTLEELKSWETASDVIHPDDLEHTVAVQRAAHEKGRAYNIASQTRILTRSSANQSIGLLSETAQHTFVPEDFNLICPRIGLRDNEASRPPASHLHRGRQN